MFHSLLFSICVCVFLIKNARSIIIHLKQDPSFNRNLFQVHCNFYTKHILGKTSCTGTLNVFKVFKKVDTINLLIKYLLQVYNFLCISSSFEQQVKAELKLPCYICNIKFFIVGMYNVLLISYFSYDKQNFIFKEL